MHDDILKKNCMGDGTINAIGGRVYWEADNFQNDAKAQLSQSTFIYKP